MYMHQNHFWDVNFAIYQYDILFYCEKCQPKEELFDITAVKTENS